MLQFKKKRQYLIIKIENESDLKKWFASYYSLMIISV